MRLPQVLRFRLARRPKIGQFLLAAVEIAFAGMAVATLEAMGRLTLDQAADVVGVLLLLLFVLLFAGAARSGRAPITRFLGSKLGATVMRAVRGLEPSAGVAFRLPEQPRPLPWTPQLSAVVVAAGLVVLTFALGAWLLDALGWIQTQVAYTPYLVLLLLLWAILGLVTTLGLLAIRALSQLPRMGLGRQPSTRLLPGIVVWAGLIVAFAAVPGWVSIAVYVVAALLASLPAFRAPAREYWMWRRDEQGRVRAARILTYLRMTWLATVLFLGLVVLLGQMPRFALALPPAGPQAITIGLGLSATAASLFLLAHGALFLARTIPPARRAPETRLERTLWWPGMDLQPKWVDDARPYGWHTVTSSNKAPADGYDLSVGVDGDPRRFRPPSEDHREDPLFLLDRRFHVVKRREFFRRFQVLHKEVTRPPQRAGTGFLFCPNAWPVPAVLRDGATTTEDGRTVFGGTHVGQPYAKVFPPRVRRYLSEVLGALQVDVIYWEDKVAWAPLRAAFGVLFENYDQGRLPAEERHFIGLTRVRVLIQEAEDVDEAFLDPLRDESAGPPPLRARVLVLRRDDPGQREETPARDPGSRLPVDLLI